VKSSSQKAAFGVAAVVAIAASGCGGSDPIGKVPCVREPVITASPHIRVDEAKGTFTPKSLRLPGGSVLFTVEVPASAKEPHGVAIDGGVYNNVAGGEVKPGHASGLTIALKPGKYTLYDPVGRNRQAGYTTKLTIGRNAPATNTVPPCVPKSHLPR
jgi:hypothetical protein